MKRTIVKQKEIEEKYGKPFKEVLGELVASKGQKGAATELGVPRSTVWYWIQREKQDKEEGERESLVDSTREHLLAPTPEPPTEDAAQTES